MEYYIEISDNCKKCGLCCTKFDQYINEDEYGKAYWNGKCITCEEDVIFDFKCLCDALTIKKIEPGKNEFIKERIDRILENSYCERITPEELSLDISENNIPYTVARGSSSYMYASPRAALKDAECELKRNTFDQINKINAKVITDFKCKLIKPYYSSDVGESFFNIINSWVTKELNILRNIIGEEEFDFSVVDVFPTESIVWKMLNDNILLADEMVEMLTTGFEYSISDYIHFIDTDSLNVSDGKNRNGEYKFVTRYQYKNVDKAIKEFRIDYANHLKAKEIIIKERFCEVCNWIIDDYNSMLRKELENRLRIVVGDTYCFSDNKIGSNTITKEIIDLRKKEYCVQLMIREKEREFENRPHINLKITNLDKYAKSKYKQLFQNCSIFFWDGKEFIRLVDNIAEHKNFVQGFDINTFLQNDNYLYILADYGDEYKVLEINLFSGDVRVLTTLDNSRDDNYICLNQYEFNRIVDGNIVLLNKNRNNDDKLNLIFIDIDNNETNVYEVTQLENGRESVRFGVSLNEIYCLSDNINKCIEVVERKGIGKRDLDYIVVHDFIAKEKTIALKYQDYVCELLKEKNDLGGYNVSVGGVTIWGKAQVKAEHGIVMLYDFKKFETIKIVVPLETYQSLSNVTYGGGYLWGMIGSRLIYSSESRYQLIRISVQDNSVEKILSIDLCNGSSSKEFGCIKDMRFEDGFIYIDGAEGRWQNFYEVGSPHIVIDVNELNWFRLPRNKIETDII